MQINKNKENKIGNLILNVFESFLKIYEFDTIKELSKSFDLCRHTAKTTLKTIVVVIESVEKRKRQKTVYKLLTLEQLQNFQPTGIIQEKVVFDSLINSEEENMINAYSTEVIDSSGKLLQAVMASRIVSESKSKLEHSKWKSLSNRVQKQKEQALSDLQNSLEKSLY